MKPFMAYGSTATNSVITVRTGGRAGLRASQAALWRLPALLEVGQPGPMGPWASPSSTRLAFGPGA